MTDFIPGKLYRLKPKNLPTNKTFSSNTLVGMETTGVGQFKLRYYFLTNTVPVMYLQRTTLKENPKHTLLSFLCPDGKIYSCIEEAANLETYEQP